MYLLFLFFPFFLSLALPMKATRLAPAPTGLRSHTPPLPRGARGGDGKCGFPCARAGQRRAGGAQLRVNPGSQGAGRPPGKESRVGLIPPHGEGRAGQDPPGKFLGRYIPLGGWVLLRMGV